MKRLVTNALALMTTDMLTKATTFFVYAMVGRYLPDQAFGQLSLALGFFYTFQVLATAGLPTIVTREVSRNHRHIKMLLGNALCLATFSSMVAMLALGLFCVVMQYDWSTMTVILLMGTALAPASASLVIEAGFRGQERMSLIAIANLPGNLIRVAGVFVLLHFGFGVLAITTLLAGSRYLVCGIEFVVAALQTRGHRFHVRKRLLGALGKRSRTFFGIDSITAIWSSVNFAILSKMLSESDVGVYSAAAQLLAPVMLVYQSVVGGMFPLMCRRAHGSDASQLAGITRWLLTLLMLIGVPGTIYLYSNADAVLTLLYGASRYGESVPMLQWLSLISIFQCIAFVMGHTLWAAHREQAVLRIVTVRLFVSIVSGIACVYFFGAMGICYAFLFVEGLNAWLHYWACRQALGAPVADRSLVAPLTGAAVMIISYWMTPLWHPIASGIVAGLAYLVMAWLALEQLTPRLAGKKTSFFAFLKST